MPVILFLLLRHASLQPFTLDLASTRAGTPPAGKITIKLGCATTSSHNLMDFAEIYGELVKRSRPSLVSAPPVRTIRSIFTPELKLTS